jgi:hypothetical protein
LKNLIKKTRSYCAVAIFGAGLLFNTSKVLSAENNKFIKKLNLNPYSIEQEIQTPTEHLEKTRSNSPYSSLMVTLTTRGSHSSSDWYSERISKGRVFLSPVGN